MGGNGHNFGISHPPVMARINSEAKVTKQPTNSIVQSFT